MTRLIAWALKHPKLAVIAVLLLITTVGGYMGYNMLVISRLETRVATLEGEVSRKESQIGTLTASVESQNKAVDEWKAKAQSRAEAADKAMREAQEAKEKADEAVGRLQAQEVMTCQEGIDLIDRELGL